MENMGLDFSKMFNGVFYKKNILVTGHTGFKGSWLSLWLYLMGANVTGYALSPSSPKDNYVLSGLKNKLIDIRGDIQDIEHVKEIFRIYKPEFVFHLAAQPIVRYSYLEPLETFETNVMGTVNILEAMRESEETKVGVIITSDKCYENKNQIWGYRETDSLGGYDPYSASKGCAEIITNAYIKSFYNPNEYRNHEKAISSVRAGNVIGGGDWSSDRLIPDCIRALEANEPISLRNPSAVRPWQHVLEPLYGYLLLASEMYQKGRNYSGAWNFGPDLEAVVTVKDVVNTLIKLWGSGSYIDVSNTKELYEAKLLNLDCTKAKLLLGWKPRLSLQDAIEYTISWYKHYEYTDIFSLCKNQIIKYMSSSKNYGADKNEVI